ncbi:MAG: ABC transporter ATP-binding protein [Acidaminobacteraceae bacterium]
MLVTNKLTKTYGDIVAVNQLDLKVERGEIFGFLGHNGAGKTTTISMLTTLIRPTSGSAKINGYDIQKENLKVRQSLGYLPENVRMYEDLTTEENLKFFGSLSKVENIDARIDEVLEVLQFSKWKDAKIKTFSKGMRQRVGIAQAIIHKPEILFLDEPTSGLDPQGTKDIREILLHLNKEWGTTIFMNTHLLSEVTKICTKIGIIKNGQLLLSENVNTVMDRFSQAKSLEEIYFEVGGGSQYD